MTTVAQVIEAARRRATAVADLSPPRALIIALGGHMKAPAKPRSPYEERGLVFM